MNKTGSIKTFFSSLIIGIVWVMALFNAITPNDILSTGSLLLVVIAYFLSEPNNLPLDKPVKINRFIIIAVFFIWLSVVVSSLVLDKANPLNLTIFRLLVTNFLIAGMLCFKRIDIVVLKFFYYAIVAYLYYLLVVSRQDAMELFVYSSGALVSAILLPLTVTIAYLEYRDSSRISLMPSFLVAILVLNTTSRTGVICSLLLLSIIFFAGIRNVKNSAVKVIINALFVVAAIYYFQRLFSSITNMDIYSKFSEKGVDNEDRALIWFSYFNDNTLQNWLFGVNASMRSILNAFPNNMHNSFINLHMQSGIVVSLLVLFAIIKTLFVNIKRRQFFYASLLFVLILYGFYNALAFFTYYDFVFYVLVFNRLLPTERKQLSLSLI